MAKFLFKKGHKVSQKTRDKISKANSGINNGSWKGGITHNAEGYRLIKSKNHPFKNISGYVFEHRLVMEKHLGRFLKKSEIVHHLDGIKTNNSIENLEVMDRGMHIREHKMIRIDINCSHCGIKIQKRPCEITKNNFCSRNCCGKFYFKQKKKFLDRSGTKWKIGKNGKRIIY